MCIRDRPEVGHDFDGESEEAKALDVLESDIEDVFIEYEEESSYEQRLACLLYTSIPRDEFIVITGLSGSGKSALAFDTIYAEGQRRYVRCV